RRTTASVATCARARIPHDQPGLLQLLREHGSASALPLCEPARAVRPLGRRHRGDPARRTRATTARTQLRRMSRRSLLVLAGGGAAVGIALRVWAVLLPQGSL